MIIISPHTLNRMWPRIQTEIQSSVYRIGINPCIREETAGLGKDRNPSVESCFRSVGVDFIALP